MERNNNKHRIASDNRRKRKIYLKRGGREQERYEWRAKGRSYLYEKSQRSRLRANISKANNNILNELSNIHE